MPFTGILGYLSFFISVGAVWFTIPHEKRIEYEQRKQFKVYMAFNLLNNIIFYSSPKLFTAMLKKTPADFQWIMAFGLPIIREINSWLRRKILHCAFDKTRSNTMELIQINISYASYISVALGTFATKSTGYVILSMDFAMNVWTAFKVTRINKKITPNQGLNAKSVEDLQSELSGLALVEIIECIVPMNHILSLVIAVYGPNSSLLGNYGNGYWQYKSIDSLEKYLMVTFEMFFVDCCSFLVGSIILWKFCSINFLREVCLQMNKHGVFIALVMAQSLCMVSLFNVTIYFKN